MKPTLHNKRCLARILIGLVILVMLSTALRPLGIGPIRAQIANCRTFSETSQTVCGRFLQYWEQNGGLAQQGLPLSQERLELNPTDGKTYTVQYFERAVLEHHPENQPPYDVLLTLLGVLEYQRRYGIVGTSPQTTSADNPRFFPETGKTIGGRFRAYWEQYGGLPQQGYPLSEEFEEESTLDGEIRVVQYFERAVFEHHPENAPPFDVLLTQLGRYRYDQMRPMDCGRRYARRGPVIAQGRNKEPTYFYELISYSLEEVVLPAPLTCDLLLPGPAKDRLQPQRLTFDKYWRLTVTGKKFYVGALAWQIWLDDRVVTSALEGSSAITGLVFDRSLLREGATIGVARGYSSEPESTVPEKLHLSQAP